MKKYFIFVFLLISIYTKAQTPVWFKVALEGDKISNTIPMNIRFGVGSCWAASINNITFTNFNTSFGSFNNVFKITDPCPTLAKEIDVQEASTMQSVIVNGATVIVPALPVIPPPPPLPPSITLQLTINPVPVVLNGTKYSCSSVVLDNTGTLILTCP